MSSPRINFSVESFCRSICFIFIPESLSENGVVKFLVVDSIFVNKWQVMQARWTLIGWARTLKDFIFPCFRPILLTSCLFIGDFE